MMMISAAAAAAAAVATTGEADATSGASTSADQRETTNASHSWEADDLGEEDEVDDMKNHENSFDHQYSSMIKDKPLRQATVKDPPQVKTFAFWTPCVFHCPLSNCPPDTIPMTNPHVVLDHLETAHKITIKKPDQCMPFLDVYISELGKRFEEIRTAVIFPNQVGCMTHINIDPDTNPVDKQLRLELQRRKLNEVLDIQERERQIDSLVPRQCIFCRFQADNRHTLFKHFFNDHSFNIGLPDNLVEVDEFLDAMRAKLERLQCLYCERTFKTSAVLRSHMRKKKHFKINPRNQSYDRFYVINYLEPGKNWESYQEEHYESDFEERGEISDSWDDWKEVGDMDSEKTMCLFCQDVSACPSHAVRHMAVRHGFNLKEVKKEKGLDFYGMIRLLNYIRYWSSQSSCYSCQEQFGTSDELDRHFEATGHASNSGVQLLGSLAPVWTDPMYLFPTFDDDPLLTWDSASDDEQIFPQ